MYFAMSDLKPLILYSNRVGSNPWKVAIILEELSLPYEHHFIAFKDMKVEWYEALNPNGRVPTLKDPNTDVTVWEVRFRSPASVRRYLMPSQQLLVRRHYRLPHRPLRQRRKAALRHIPRKIHDPLMGALPNVRPRTSMGPDGLVPHLPSRETPLCYRAL